MTMNDNESPRRAANGLLAKTLPAHGRHAQPNDMSLTLGTTADGTMVAYPSAVNPTPERQSNVVEAKIALNTRRRGTVQAAEGLARRDVNIERTFAEGFGNARAYSSPAYEAQIAGQGSALAARAGDTGSATWQTANVMGAMPDFMGSAVDLAPLPGNVPALRRGANAATFTRLSRLDLSERGRTNYGKVYGSDFKQPRRNEAEVND